MLFLLMKALVRNYKNTQMDIIVRYFDDKKLKVINQYLTPEFLRNCSSNDLLHHLKKATIGFDQNKWIQLSMDGPAVNWALFKTLNKERDNQQLPKLVNIGSCNLHVLHGAFQKGAETTGWKLKRLLKHLHFLFYNAGARRGDFIKVTGSQ